MIARDLHESYEELVVGYALSALEPEQEQEFLRHLAGCARCEQSLARHRQTLAHLAYAVEPATPPPALLESIRLRIAAEGAAGSAPRLPFAGDGVPAGERTTPAGPTGTVELPGERTPVGPLAGSAAGPDAGTPADSATAPAASADPSGSVGAHPVDELARARSRRSRRAVAWTSVAAALALVVGLGSWNVVLQQDRDRTNRQTTRLNQAVQALEKGPARTVPLRSEDSAASVIAVVQPDWSMSLVVDGLAPNDRADSTYVLWAVQGISPRALATFDVSSRKLEVLTDVPIPADVRSVPDGFAVTRELGRTAPEAPRNPILVQGRTTT